MPPEQADNLSLEADEGGGCLSLKPGDNGIRQRSARAGSTILVRVRAEVSDSKILLL